MSSLDVLQFVWNLSPICSIILFLSPSKTTLNSTLKIRNYLCPFCVHLFLKYCQIMLWSHFNGHWAFLKMNLLQLTTPGVDVHNKRWNFASWGHIVQHGSSIMVYMTLLILRKSECQAGPTIGITFSVMFPAKLWNDWTVRSVHF
jgi:hypothetical protein